MFKCISIAQARTKCGPWSWRGTFPVNFRAKWLVHFDCEASHEVWSWVLGRGIFPVNLDIKLLL